LSRRRADAGDRHACAPFPLLAGLTARAACSGGSSSRPALPPAAYVADRETPSFGTGVLREENRRVRGADLTGIAGGSAMRITARGPVERTGATWYRVGGMTTADEKRVKFLTMIARLTGDDRAAVAFHLSARALDARSAIGRFLAAGPPGRLAATVIGRR
jgi:hypothetical protein